MHLPSKLDADDEAALSRSIGTLPAGDRGWITMQEARALFSLLGDQYAFGDTDAASRSKSRHLPPRPRTARRMISCPLKAELTLPTWRADGI